MSIILFSIASLSFSCKNQSSEKVNDEKISVDSDSSTIYPSEVENDSVAKKNSTAVNDSVKVSVKTFQEKSEWGYDILIDNKLYIHQPTIPSVPGNNSFKTEDDARKTADFVAYKIEHHIMPPSVTPEELDSLGVWKKQK